MSDNTDRMASVSYLHSSSSFQNHYDTVRDRLMLQARQHGESEVYVFISPDGERVAISAEALNSRSLALARSLVKLGVRKGDVVAACLQNDLDCLICTFGVICAGGIIAYIMVHHKDGSDVREALKKLGAKVLVLNPGVGEINLRSCMNLISEVSDAGKVTSDVLSLQYLISTHPAENLSLLLLGTLIGQNNEEVQLPYLDAEDTIAYFPTSGSTGESKYVPQSHHTAMLFGQQFKEAIGYEDGDCIYNERRISWIGGFPYSYLHDGVKTVTKTMAFSNSVQHCAVIYEVMIKEQCNVGALQPATLVGLIDIAKEEDIPRLQLKKIHIGGIPLAAVCMDAIGLFTKVVTNTYGSTECGLCSSLHVCNKADFINHCAGTPHSGVEIKVKDESGKVLPRGEFGSIYIRSQSLFWYYHGDPEKTQAVLDTKHWFDTDDVGYVTQDGKLVARGRKSEIILQAGNYIVPSTLEAFIKNHPDVLDVIVVSIPDPELFLMACACVLPKSGRTLTANDIDDFYKEHFVTPVIDAYFREGPQLIEIVTDYPRTHTGKPDKRELQRIMRQKHGR
ncbi:3-[(3aS,4S,7aS)-7a-methyl-1,5-dioxo-octahydro-1H-inden-4-yl]propanoyl:CoA ligase-like [Mya arenaria]|uniref:3-[(3aS,4S,7aS)-7a-methyl-1, 5-dioxo-octahydro-1H-inden-4-yl]propanoyl:CoA ligase-like n=1 Tax=Mya arenaria TaxID=6604 RepID=UPI0022DEEA0C|nr:3-[(3aS,4S,7aS)-7a-methyl-1,5-dioxo-octahydro-1H-inden-4-yl]propanoyl:CoA ligase-like [Mya arenaria]